MSLLALQTAFREEIAASDEEIAPSSLGMEIYRDAYRGRLLATLETSFERTRRWVGAEAFTTAACHYILSRPPRGWTLDLYGADFPDLLETLFASDPEVAELAWLEWRMQNAFAAPDLGELDTAALAATGYADADWDRLGFAMAAGFAARRITTNLSALWATLADGSGNDFHVKRSESEHLLVWRSNLAPRFRLAGDAEFQALDTIVRGGTLGDLALHTDTARLSAWLSQWLCEGLFSSSAIR